MALLLSYDSSLSIMPFDIAGVHILLYREVKFRYLLGITRRRPNLIIKVLFYYFFDHNYIKNLDQVLPNLRLVQRK
jgi:hypothetical protein